MFLGLGQANFRANLICVWYSFSVMDVYALASITLISALICAREVVQCATQPSGHISPILSFPIFYYTQSTNLLYMLRALLRHGAAI